MVLQPCGAVGWELSYSGSHALHSRDDSHFAHSKSAIAAGIVGRAVTELLLLMQLVEVMEYVGWLSAETRRQFSVVQALIPCLAWLIWNRIPDNVHFTNQDSAADNHSESNDWEIDRSKISSANIDVLPGEDVPPQQTSQ